MSAKWKLSLYMLALLVLHIQAGTADYTADDVATWKVWDWFKLGIGILGSLAVSMRMFFDQSVAREQIANGEGHKLLPIPSQVGGPESEKSQQPTEKTT